MLAMVRTTLRKFLLLLGCQQSIDLRSAVLANVLNLRLLLVLAKRIVGLDSLNLLLLVLPDLLHLRLLVRRQTEAILARLALRSGGSSWGSISGCALCRCNTGK